MSLYTKRKKKHTSDDNGTSFIVKYRHSIVFALLLMMTTGSVMAYNNYEARRAESYLADSSGTGNAADGQNSGGASGADAQNTSGGSAGTSTLTGDAGGAATGADSDDGSGTALGEYDRIDEATGRIIRNGGGAATEAGTATDTTVYPDFSKNEITWNGKTYKRNTYIKPILMLGVDNSGDMHTAKEYGYAGQCDAVILAAHDTARNTVKLLMIPRDTMTEVMEMSRKTGIVKPYTDHLCLSYCFGDGMEQSCENSRLAVQTLLMELPITDYISVDTSVMAVVNDAVGGVTVTIPTEGMEKADAAFVYGETVTLRGTQAERFVRFRDTDVDNSALSRMNQHRQYITGFYKSLKQKSKTDSNIVTDIYGLIQDYMITNMSKDRYLKTALDVLQQEDIEDSSILALPGYGTTSEKFDEYYASKTGIVQVLLNLFYREVQ